MESNFEYEQNSMEKTIVHKLLKHEMTSHDFLGQLIQQDQKTDTHEEALQNIAILESSEVATYFLEHDQERLKEDYHNVLSLSYFHAAQIQAVIHKQDAAEYFEKAFIESELTESEPFRDWRLYMFGTMKYLSEDVEGLDAALNLLTNEINKSALQRLKAGLVTYKTADYSRDYMPKE